MKRILIQFAEKVPHCNIDVVLHLSFNCVILILNTEIHKL